MGWFYHEAMGQDHFQSTSVAKHFLELHKFGDSSTLESTISLNTFK
jgi:hypothetical protein